MKAVGQKLIRQVSLRAEVMAPFEASEPKPSVVAVRVTNAGNVTQEAPERQREVSRATVPCAPRPLRHIASTAGSWSWASLELIPAFEKTSMPKGADSKVHRHGRGCPMVQASFGPSEIRACETSNGISLPCTASNCKHREAEATSILRGITRKVPTICHDGTMKANLEPTVNEEKSIKTSP